MVIIFTDNKLHLKFEQNTISWSCGNIMFYRFFYVSKFQLKNFNSDYYTNERYWVNYDNNQLLDVSFSGKVVTFLSSAGPSPIVFLVLKDIIYCVDGLRLFII